jgi:hypothetical protein
VTSGPSVAAWGLFSAIHTGEPQQLEGCTLKFYLNSGASGHYIPDVEHLHDLHMYKVPKNIQMASRAYVQVKGIGTLKFEVEDRGTTFIGAMPNVEWTPNVKVHLLNPGQLFKDGYSVALDREEVMITNPNLQKIMHIKEHGNVYPFELCILVSTPLQISYSSITDKELAHRLDDNPVALHAKEARNMMRWHQCLGHLHTHTI